IGFRDFEHLTTSEFPHLKEVWHGQFPVQVFCNLKSLVIDDCANISSAISGNLLQHLNSLEKLHVRNSDSLEEVFDLEELKADGDLKVLSQLSEFFLVDLPRLEHIWQKNHSEVLGFRNLKLMKVYNCSSLRYIFTPSVILGLMQLQKLEIKNCAIMEEIITKEGENDAAAIEKITFLQLNCLVVESLPNLTSFYSGSSTLECPSLTTIDISYCPKMETFVFTHLKDICTGITPLFSEKVSFSCLKKLKLSKLPELLHLWKKNSQPRKVFENLAYLKVLSCSNLKTLVPSSVSLQNLETLEVQNCNGLISLVTFSTAKSLEQLKRMEIIYCKLIEEIIVDTGDEIKDGIVFNQLEYLNLDCLPSLTSFCKGNFTIEFPYLQRVLVIKCLKMMNFSLGVLSTPKLQSLQTREIATGCIFRRLSKHLDIKNEYWEGDLNTTIQKLFRDMSNMEELKTQVEKLTDQRETVQHSVDEAKRQGDEIEKRVEKWLDRVDVFTNGVVKPIIDGQYKAGTLCSIGFCPNLMARYCLSRKAAKTTKDGVDLLGEGTFQKVSYRPLLQKTTSTYIRGYDDFDSRKPIFDNLMEALTDADVNLIGVYGMGGVGKTTLAKRVVGQAKQDKLFDVVVMAEVTETPDIKNIQAQIADQLGLKFVEESLSGRAARLCDKLKKEKRVLLVLDNIWAKLDLEAVGIPLGEEEKRSALQKQDWKGRNDEQGRGKILFTSRNLHVLRDDMNTQKNFFVEILSVEEAEKLFWMIVGLSEKKPDLNPIAVEIVEKCAGLPVAIATIASALKNKSLFVWKNALEQLRTSNPRNIKGMDANVYSAIELSYNYLEDEEAKSLFLLCGLMAASGLIRHHELFKYAMGWGLFQDVHTTEQGRNRLHTLIDSLTASCLLLENNYGNFSMIKMHDIIHAVALSIASTEKLMFNIRSVTRLKEMLEEKLPRDATAVSLPYDLFSWKLDSYIIFIGDVWGQFENCSETSKTLRLKWSNIFYLDNGIKTLLNITEDLHLDELKGVKNILYELDKEGFPQLKHLHVQNGLEVQDIINSERLGPSTFFPKLESLFLYNLINLEKICNCQLAIESFSKLRIVKVEKCDRLKHLFSFSMAKNLLQLEEIEVINCKKLEEIVFNNNDKQYHQNGRVNRTEFTRLHTLRLQCLPQLTSFGLHAFTPEIGSQEIVAEDELGGCMPSFSQNVLLPNLENLKLSSINIECLWLDQLPAMSSCCQTLTRLTLEECSGNLKFLFSYSMVKSLVQLQKLEIRNCKSIEGIINTEELNGEGNTVEFPKLIKLQLKGLPNLTQFASGNIVELPTLTSLNLSSIASQTIWHNQLQPHSVCFHKLTELSIYGCHNLKYLFPISVAESLNHLKDLHIYDCKLMEGVIITQGERKSSTMFPKLKQLSLDDLPELTRFCNFNGNSIELPSLSELIINNCPKMQTFASNSLPGIEEPEEVNTDTEENLPSFFDEKVSFSCLKTIKLSELPELLHLWKKNSQPRKVFENLAYLEVSSCVNLKTLIPSSVSLQNLETLEVRNCDGLISLVTFSTAKSLKQLKIMEIIDCKLIEEIIVDMGDEIKDGIVFNQLGYLKLDCLPSLTSFCKGNFTIEFPYLQRVLVIECLKMMNFSQGVLSTPNLQSLRMTESIDEWKWKFKGPEEDDEWEGEEDEWEGEEWEGEEDEWEGEEWEGEEWEGEEDEWEGEEWEGEEDEWEGEEDKEDEWEGEEDKEDEGCWEGDLNTTIQKLFRDATQIMSKAFSVDNNHVEIDLLVQMK
ncbi:hypothetical protein Dsin_007466, partial [Dipteronia sinensis]